MEQYNKHPALDTSRRGQACPPALLSSSLAKKLTNDLPCLQQTFSGFCLEGIGSHP
jgi:hypothetical protein